MKFNWKILAALVVLVGATFWGLNSLRTYSYSGTGLNFDVGKGPVTVTNSTDVSVPVQLIGAGTRIFSVSSTSEDISGRSERQGTGSTSTQLFEFDLPPGITELRVVARSTTVSFVADTGTILAATVQPMTDSRTQMAIITAVVVIVGSLFYISRATGHRWINRFRHEKVAIHDTQPHVVTSVSDS